MYSEEQLQMIDNLVATTVMGWHLSECTMMDMRTNHWSRRSCWEDGEGRYGAMVNDWHIGNVPSDGAPDLLPDYPGWHPTQRRDDALRVFAACPDMVLEHKGEGYNAHGPIDWKAGNFGYYADAPTPMLAICLAALRRAGVEVPNAQV